MKQFGLIGHPLSHSFSKKYFNDKFSKEHLNECFFENYDLASIEELKPLLEATPDLKGLCVTIPYKQKVIEYLNVIEDAVQITGACNSIKIDNGLLYGYNTDIIGFEDSLKSHVSQLHTAALILGTGGASKAVAFVLNKLQIPFLFVSRNRDSSNNNINYSEVDNKIFQDYQLIINTTPLGMYPNINEAPPIPYEKLTDNHFLFDLTYNPLETLFMRKGKQYGASTLNGYEMLIGQAEASWKIWNS